MLALMQDPHIHVRTLAQISKSIFGVPRMDYLMQVHDGIDMFCPQWVKVELGKLTAMDGDRSSTILTKFMDKFVEKIDDMHDFMENLSGPSPFHPKGSDSLAAC